MNKYKNKYLGTRVFTNTTVTVVKHNSIHRQTVAVASYMPFTGYMIFEIKYIILFKGFC